MPSVSMRQLLEAGVHFGHQTRRWNPKMRPFIFAERNGIHIIDLAQTVKRLDLALAAARDTVARGESVLFIGTKKQAQEPIALEAARAGQPYVNRRWLGGMLTNFVTIKKRITLLDQLEARQLSGDFERLTKKEAAKLTEEMEHLRASFGGIRKMKRLPGMVFIVDPHRERSSARATPTSTRTSSTTSFPPTTMPSGPSGCCARWSPTPASKGSRSDQPAPLRKRRSPRRPSRPRPRRLLHRSSWPLSPEARL
jgi:ribosomal protein S2